MEIKSVIYSTKNMTKKKVAVVARESVISTLSPIERRFEVKGTLDPSLFKEFSEKAKKLSDHVQDVCGVVICGMYGSSDPTFTTREVSFNGNYYAKDKAGERTPQSGEPFYLVVYSEDYVGRSDTKGHPYDVLVGAVIVLMQDVFPNVTIDLGDTEFNQKSIQDLYSVVFEEKIKVEIKKPTAKKARVMVATKTPIEVLTDKFAELSTSFSTLKAEVGLRKEEKELVAFAKGLLKQEETLYTVDEVSKLLEHEGRNRCYSKLRDMGYVMIDSTRPTQKAVEEGLMKMAMGTNYRTKTMVTSKGLHKFKRLWDSTKNLDTMLPTQ